MPSLPLHQTCYVALDLRLVSASSSVRTNWHVITGAPSSGKSTLIEQLANAGFKTIPETARRYIEEEMAGGRSVEEIKANRPKLQQTIHKKRLAVERGLRPTDILILDCALPCSLAWHRAVGLDPNQILSQCTQFVYASVFKLMPLPFRLDSARGAAEATMVDYLDEWLARDYTALGYQVVSVPPLPAEDRLAFVLDRIPAQ